VLGTYCHNDTCDEYLVAKSVDPVLAAAEIQCGSCGHTTEPTAEITAEPGERVAAP
jgi:hypothetical protein